VALAVAPPLQEAADGQDVAARAWIGAEVPLERLLGELLDADAADARGGTGEVAVDELWAPQ
jgi:hypothetical protein